MLDRDLAALYGVDVKVLNQAMRRNISRFPADFMFQLSINEAPLRLHRTGRKLEELERKYDGQFGAVFDAIRALMSPPTTPRRAIGFRGTRVSS